MLDTDIWTAVSARFERSFVGCLPGEDASSAFPSWVYPRLGTGRRRRCVSNWIVHTQGCNTTILSLKGSVSLLNYFLTVFPEL